MAFLAAYLETAWPPILATASTLALVGIWVQLIDIKEILRGQSQEKDAEDEEG